MWRGKDGSCDRPREAYQKKKICFSYIFFVERRIIFGDFCLTNVAVITTCSVVPKQKYVSSRVNLRETVRKRLSKKFLIISASKYYGV